MTAVRTGIGYDAHRFIEGRRLVLGGVEIPHEFGLDGHSDADVVLHAITDALLGAAALGDIGQHFPPSDPAYRDQSSLTFLGYARSLLTGSGFRVVNVDCNVVAEAPKILPHALAMRETIAAALGITISGVSIKATTNEGMGFTGRQEGIAAMAVASISSIPPDADS